MTPHDRLTIGLDLGKLRDFTAVCVVQYRAAEFAPRTRDIHFDEEGRSILPGQRLRAARYNVGHLRRFKLGTPYPKLLKKFGHYGTGYPARQNLWWMRRDVGCRSSIISIKPG